MEKHGAASNAYYTAEAEQIVKTVLERQRLAIAEPQQGEDPPPPDPDGRRVNRVRGTDLTVEVGERQVAELIRSWELPPRWLHRLDFVCTTETERRVFRHYRARFSAPTARRPIRGTACVHFAVHASTAGGHTLPAEVHFVVESHRLVHTAAGDGGGGATAMAERWLEDVVESKTLLREAMQLAIR